MHQTLTCPTATQEKGLYLDKSQLEAQGYNSYLDSSQIKAMNEPHFIMQQLTAQGKDSNLDITARGTRQQANLDMSLLAQGLRVLRHKEMGHIMTCHSPWQKKTNGLLA